MCADAEALEQARCPEKAGSEKHSLRLMDTRGRWQRPRLSLARRDVGMRLWLKNCALHEC